MTEKDKKLHFFSTFFTFLLDFFKKYAILYIAYFSRELFPEFFFDISIHSIPDIQAGRVCLHCFNPQKKPEEICKMSLYHEMKNSMCLLTADEVCEIFRISRRTLQRWLNKGLINHVKIGGKLIFRFDDVNRVFLNDTEKEKGA